MSGGLSWVLYYPGYWKQTLSFLDGLRFLVTRIYLSTNFNTFRGDEVCCSRTGCYSNDAPFDHLPLPMCPEEVNPDYFLYTRESQGIPEHFNHDTPPYDFIFS